jgi:hypothetical protein
LARIAALGVSVFSCAEFYPAVAISCSHLRNQLVFCRSWLPRTAISLRWSSPHLLHRRRRSAMIHMMIQSISAKGAIKMAEAQKTDAGSLRGTLLASTDARALAALSSPRALA